MVGRMELRCSTRRLNPQESDRCAFHVDRASVWGVLMDNARAAGGNTGLDTITQDDPECVEP